MPRKESSQDIPQDRNQLLKELATLRARARSIEEALADTSAPGSASDAALSASHPQAYPLGDPAFPYQRMVEELSEGLVALSPTHAIRYVNRRFAALLDISPERLLDMDFYDLIVLEDRERFEELLKGSVQQHVELQLIGRDERRVLVETSTRDWVVDGIRTFLVVRDLSERRQDRALLTFQTFLLENVNDAVIVLDPQFRISYWNTGAERLYGWTAVEAIGHPMPDLMSSGATDAERAQIVEHLGSIDKPTGQVMHYRKDGKPLRIEWNTLPLRDAAGALTGFVSVARDITPRRQTQQALQDSEQYFARVFERSPTAMLITHLTDGRILDVNDRFLRLTGYRREQLVGQTTTEVQLWDEPGGRPDFTRILAPAAHNLQLRLRTQAGDMRDVRVAADRIGRQGEDIILTMIDDITERKRFEQQLRTHTQQVRQYAADMQRYAQDAQRHAEERQQHAMRLERMVRERTATLEATNEELKKEISARQSEILIRENTEAKLRQVLRSLEDTMLAFRKSEELLRIGIEAAGLVAWTYDPVKDNVVTIARTENWAKMMPEERAPLFGRGIEYVHPDDRAKVTETLARVLAGEAFSQELRLLLPNGAPRWIVTRGRLLTGVSDPHPLVVGVTQDITEHRQIEDELRRLNRELDAERARWQGVVEGIADEVWVANAEGKISLINLPEVTAMGLAEFTNKTVAQIYEQVDLLTPDGRIRPVEDAPLLRALKGEIVRGEEIMRHRESGRTRHRQYSAAPMRDSGGTITGAVAIVRDITEHKNVQQALRESEERLRVAAEAANIGVWNWKPQTGEVKVSANWNIVFGVSPETDVTFETWRNALHPNDRDTAVNALLFAADSGTEYNVEYRVVWPDGSVRWVADRGRGTYDASGRAVNFAGVNVDITERKRTEEALRQALESASQSEERFRSLYHSLPYLAVVFQKQGAEFILTEYNQTAVTLTRGGVAALVGQTARAIYSTRPDMLERIERAFAEQTVIKYESPYRMVTTGEDKYTISTFVFVPPDRVLLHTEDITDRKRAEAALQAANQRTKDILESIQDGFFALNREWQFTYLNQRARGILDPSSPELTGRNLWQEFPKLVGTPLETAYRQAMVKGIPVHLEQGGIITGAVYDIRVYPSAEGISVYWIDITERKRAQEEIKTLARFPAENPNPVLRLNPAGVILYANDASSPLLDGWGISVGDIVPQPLCGVIAHAFEFQQGRVVDVELKDCFYSFSIAPIHESGYVNLYGRDITDRRRAENQVQQLNQHLERRAVELEIANNELESFTYSVSHDLRAPLSFIDVITTTLQQDHGAQLPGHIQRYLDLIRANAKQMDELITSLLALSRLNRQPLQRKPVDMLGLVHEALETLQKQIQRPDMTIEVHDMPNVEADPVLLKQVWVNLIANAAKFTRKCGNAHIEIGCEPCDGKDPVYYVRDNGVGFDMAQADRLFGVFQRLHNEEDYEGTGVGLAIVQRIIRRHGGRIWAEAQVDQGATFYFAFS